MAIVRLGDVAREYKATIKDSSCMRAVGLEHLTPGEIALEHWDEQGDNTFTKGFKKGQMLFGRRRSYQKKAALAPFDGVCSGDITVTAFFAQIIFGNFSYISQHMGSYSPQGIFAARFILDINARSSSSVMIIFSFSNLFINSRFFRGDC